MRAKDEYEKWCYEGCGGYLPSEEGRKSYTTGFNRAIELMETFLKEKEYETISEITCSRTTTKREETTTSNRH